jgi:hypothetical protein
MATAFAASLIALAAPGPTALAGSASGPLKAVIIVGPSGASTERYLDRGEEIADSAAAHGMDVVRIFHPRATWRRVRDKIQGANFVAYLGHGNGWPSPYAPFNPRTKDGLGLDPYEGASAYTHRYKGEDPIRRRIVLAPNAVVLLSNLCYASGNGEPHHGIPSARVARERADNYASAFLDVGAGAVFAFGWEQEFDLFDELLTTDQTMDQVFMTRTPGAEKYYTGFVGWDDDRYKSQRVAGARVHLDPHPRYGYYRSLTGDLSLTTGAWRGEASEPAT